MKQIIAIIIIIGVSLIFEAFKNWAKKATAASVLPAKPSRLPDLPKSDLPPLPAEHVEPEPFLTVDMPKPGYQPLVVVEEPLETVEEVTEAGYGVINADEVDDETERWRRAIIDSEILARRF